MRARSSAATALAIVGLAAAIAASSQATAGSQTRTHVYDGLWSVSIHTQSGPCDPGYRYPARIVGGRVRQPDNDASYQVSGAVAENGAITVKVSRGGQSAIGRGRLRGGSGSGRWRTVGNKCHGTWSAMRRAAD